MYTLITLITLSVIFGNLYFYNKYKEYKKLRKRNKWGLYAHSYSNFMFDQEGYPAIFYVFSIFYYVGVLIFTIMLMIEYLP